MDIEYSSSFFYDVSNEVNKGPDFARDESVLALNAKDQIENLKWLSPCFGGYAETWLKAVYYLLSRREY
jgi:hypothetical protein